MGADDVENFSTSDAPNKPNELTNSAFAKAPGVSSFIQFRQTTDGDGDPVPSDQPPHTLSTTTIFTQSKSPPEVTAGENDSAIDPTTTGASTATLEPSRAFCEAEFFEELTAPEPTQIPKPQTEIVEQDDISIKDFEGYVRTNLGREIDYRHPERLTYAERLVVGQGRRYAIAKVKERRHKRENPDEFMNYEDFEKALNIILVR